MVRLSASQGAKPLSVRLAPDNFTAQGSVWCGGSFRGVGVEGAMSTSASLLLMLQNSCKFVQLGSLSPILQGLLICKWRRISDINRSFLNCGSRLQGHPSTIYPHQSSEIKGFSMVSEEGQRMAKKGPVFF